LIALATIPVMSVDPWRYRARRAVAARLRTNGETRPHYVVCGNDALTYRLVKELVAASAGRVTVIVPNKRRSEVDDLSRIKGIQIVRADRLTEETFRAAGLAGAECLALVHQDDVGNIHAALCAQAVEPRIRLVMRIFSSRLGSGVKRLFADCEVMSDSAMAAPAFVAAALGEPAPTHFRHAGRTLYVARRDDVRPDTIVCGLADTRQRNNPRVLPANPGDADLVLAEATGQPSGTVLAARKLVRKRRRRRPLAAAIRGLRAFVNRKTGVATITVLAIVAVFGTLLARSQDLNLWQALYFTLLTTITGSDVQLNAGWGVQVMQVILTVAGLALIPLITAAVVEAVVNARLALNVGRLRTPRVDHVVVVGLGNVGTRVIRQLNDLGVEVVAIDKAPEARGAAVARRLEIPLIVGDVAQEEVLRSASVETCQALVVVSTDDVANLQAALNGRALRADLRVVMRLFDGDLAKRIQRAFDIAVSRSVSYLAAPSFAAAMMNRDVIATIPVDRHALLVAEVPVAHGSPLDGKVVGQATRPDAVRVIALHKFGEPRPIWSPQTAYRVNGGDRLTVVARRAGLGWLVKQTMPAPPEMSGPTEPPA
jgi:Trk K+ transport system NAD-binding subunit